MSIVPLSFLNQHWLSGKRQFWPRCSFKRFSRIFVIIFWAIDNLDKKQKCPYGCHRLSRRFSFRLYRWSSDASLKFCGIASVLHTQWNNSVSCSAIRLTTCFIDLSRYCVWTRDLVRWQMLNGFRCFRDSSEFIKQGILHCTCGSLLTALSLIDDERLSTLTKYRTSSAISVLPSALRSGVVPELFDHKFS